MGSKGSSGAASYNYYGSLIAAVCRGPVDAVHALIVDGKEIFTGPATRGGTDYVDLTPTITAADGKWFHSGGKAYLFWGTETQDISTDSNEFADHPNYRGVCVLRMTGLLFGRERTTAPNIEIVVSRKPVASTDLVAANDNTTTDGQVNPVAAIVELLTGSQDAGIPVAMFHTSDWLTAATYCAANKPRFFCSPLLTEQMSARDAIGTLLSMFDACLYWTSAGKLGIRLLKPGVDPGGLPTLDAPLITEKPRIDGQGWLDVPTTVLARYFDRSASYKERQAKHDNLLALRSRGLSKSLDVDLPHVTRADQASAIAAEIVRRTSRPPGSIELKVRRFHASGIGPGSKVLVDIDPEPGGDGLSQLCVVKTRTEDSLGPVRLNLTPDTLVDSVPYSPSHTVTNPDEATCQPIDEDTALVIPLPQSGWDTVGAVAALAPRPDATVTGFRSFFDSTSSNNDPDEWADLGHQIGFACQMTLDADVAEDDTEFDLSMTEGVAGPDAYLTGRLPDNSLDAEQDKLLLILANLDVNDRVKITDGQPELEICSVITRTNPQNNGASHTYSVHRSRRGTSSQAWVENDSPRCYIVPLSNITPLTHPSITAMMTSGDVGYLRLRAYSEAAEADACELSFCFPSGFNPFPIVGWTTPDNGQGAADGSGHYTPDLTVTDNNGDLVAVTISSRKADGSGYVEHHAVTLAPTGSYRFNSQLTFADGVHNLTVVATDKAGNTTTSSVTITKEAPGALMPPTFDPMGPTYYGAAVSVTMTAPNDADRVQWVIGSFGSAEPTSWPNQTNSGTKTKTVTITGRKRLWARSKQDTGPVYSAATWDDYEPEV